MYKPDEKDIDRLSREAAEHYHAPGQPSWDALQQILDKELPQEKEKKRRGFFFFLLLLLGLSLAGSGIWYSVQINHKNKSITPGDIPAADSKHRLPVDAQTNTANNKPATGQQAASDNAAKTSSAPTKSATETGTPVTENTAAENNAGISGNRTARKLTATHAPVSLPLAAATTHAKAENNRTGEVADKVAPNTTHQPNIAPVSSGKQTSAGAFVAGHLTAATKGRHHAPTGTNGTVKKGKKPAVSTIENSNNAADNVTDGGNTKTNSNTDATDAVKTDDPKTTAAAPDTKNNQPADLKKAVADLPPAKTDKKDSANTAKKKAKSKNEKAIIIGLTAGLDLSTVKFTHGDNIGYNFGIKAGYQFSKHWSVYTGAIYTKKNYNLNGKDFHPPHPYFTLYVNLQNVEGYCKMWEIPLQAKYTFNPGAKTAFFASTGLSSYIMTRQYYNYSWKNNMNQPMTGSWGTDSTFKHVFSILHLSAGFEKQLGKHMNWQIEPYAKIPLGGVGFGNIRLSSFGINFSVQYRHPVKR